MRFRSATALLAAMTLMAACDPLDTPGGRSGSANLQTDAQKASYAIGIDMGRNLQPAQGHIDMDALMAGLQASMAGEDPALPQEELNAALQTLSQTINEEQMAERDAAGQRSSEEGRAFLAENGAKEGVTTTASGLQYEVINDTDGPTPGADDTVVVHYVGTLLDGTVFDSSRDRGQPATFPVGGVISGFGEAVQLMSVGDVYRFWIPGDIAYGPNGNPPVIPPNATLVFELELMEIQ